MFGAVLLVGVFRYGSVAGALIGLAVGLLAGAWSVLRARYDLPSIASTNLGKALPWIVLFALFTAAQHGHRGLALSVAVALVGAAALAVPLSAILARRAKDP